MIIKNISDHDFEFSWEDFNTYFFPKNKIVEVSNDLGEFIRGRWPRAFSFDLEVTKGVKSVTFTPSKSFIKREEQPEISQTMRTSFGHDKATFGMTEPTLNSGKTTVDGVELEGEGLVYE